MKEIKTNLIYNIIYQILLLIVPLITTPYISRTLGPNGVGIYTFSYSITYYFMIFALLGINNYGNRVIAKSKNDKLKLSKNFLSIYALQIILNLISISFYIIYLFLFCEKYFIVSLINIIFLFSNMLDINWFFFGIEKFKITVIRNIVIKIVSLFFIFLFIKNENDVWLYALIIAGSTLISQLSLFPFLKKEIVCQKIKFNDIKIHLKPCLILFLPVVAISIYKFMDKIMVGIIVNTIEVGYYEQAERIINIPMGIITALGVVMMPRISNLVAKKNFKLVRVYIEKSINFMMFLAFPLMFGIIAISNNFVPLFMGDKFTNSVILTNTLALTIPFISYANIIRTEYLLPNELDKQYVTSILIGALINLVLNLCLIPEYAAFGASVATVVAEFSVMLYQVITCRKVLNSKKYLKNIIPFFIKALFMYLIVIQINKLSLNGWIIVCLQIIVGIFIYLLFNIKYLISIIYEREECEL